MESPCQGKRWSLASPRSLDGVGLFLSVGGHLALKLQESVSEIPSRSEKHPMRKTTIEEEFGCCWTL